jgi:hypothetical protein
MTFTDGAVVQEMDALRARLMFKVSAKWMRRIRRPFDVPVRSGKHEISRKIQCSFVTCRAADGRMRCGTSGNYC